MDYEKKYKDAVSKIKSIIADKKKQGLTNCLFKGDLNEIFPELKESEDERIRKAIHVYLDWLDGRKDIEPRGEYSIRDMIAWLEKQGEEKVYSVWVGGSEINDYYLTEEEAKKLAREYKEDGYDDVIIEKQGEQKSTNIEPKFKIGDWIVKNNGKDCFSDGSYVLQIMDIDDISYKLSNGYYLTEPFTDTYRLWTIEDAKDGDVLLFEGYYNSIVLFQGIGINGKGRINYHCKCDLGNYSFGVQGDVACMGTLEKDAEHYHPTTKEQRDLLFKKMKEAGYKWDADKKELKKIEQKPAWSEEDEERIEQICEDLKCGLENFRSGKNVKGLHFEEIINSNINWLKSLKNRVQPHWKPTEEQIK